MTIDRIRGFEQRFMRNQSHVGPATTSGGRLVEAMQSTQQANDGTSSGDQSNGIMG